MASQRNDAPANPSYLQSHVHDRSRPENLAIVALLRTEADRAACKMPLGAVRCDRQVERMAEYTQASPSGCHIARAVTHYGANGASPCWAFSNHDGVRVATRWATAGNRDRVQLQPPMLLSVRGLICLYRGAGLDLPQSEVPRPRLQNPKAIRLWPNHRGQSGVRTPMPWVANGVSLGLSPVDGWLPAVVGQPGLAIDLQDGDPASPLNHLPALTALRSPHPAQRPGSFDVLTATKTAPAFRRRHADESPICGFNFAKDPIALSFRGPTLAGYVASGSLAPDSHVILKEKP